MLQLKLKEKNEIDSSGTRVYLTDNTGEESELNTGGYGINNGFRESYAIYPVGYSVDSKGKESPLVFQLYNPLTSIEWVAKVAQDGWLKFKLVGFPAVDDLNFPENTELNSIVFSIANFALFKRVEVETLVDSGFVFDPEFPDILPPEPVTELVPTFEPYLLDVSLATGLTSLYFEQFFVANSSKTLITLNKQVVESYINSENLSNTKRINLLQEQYDKVRGILQAAIYQFCIGNKFAAQKFIEFLQTNNYGQL